MLEWRVTLLRNKKHMKNNSEKSYLF